MHFILQAKSVPNLLEQEAALLASHPGWVPFFRRYFLSEASQRNLFPEREGAVSYIILHAPVCRPGWLVEMECLACLKA